ncbi:hypothetical protein [Microbacterium rhizophilus]|uniref:hypothetical protein n=1 Tax=Microbacterium rhizophilus TaxID=3138934 RepID=UPI0031EC14B4
MDGQLIAALLGLVVAIVVPVAIHRATHPKRQLSYHLAVHAPPPQPGVAPVAPPPGVPAHQPVPVTLLVWSTGRADVATTAFDAGRPILFRLAGRVTQPPRPLDVPDGWSMSLVGNRDVTLGPVLIGRGTVFAAELLVEGPISVRVWNSLVDTAVVHSPVPPQSRDLRVGVKRRLSAMTIGVSAIVLALALEIISIAIVTENRAATVALTLTAALLGLVGIVTVIVSGITRITRYVRARATARNVPGKQRIHG